jgi:hypothetical protein
MHSYKAFSLTFHSQLFFPELRTIASKEHDITIRYGQISQEDLGDLTTIGVYYQAQPDCWGLHVPQVGRFLVSDGNNIIVDPVDGIDEDSLRAFILGPCMVALLMQRDVFLLHGNALKVGESCVSFAGDHGTGKSTLSAAFSRRGYAILTDDICAINSRGEVLPGAPQIDIWHDVASQLMIDTKPLRKIRPCIEKFALPLADNYCSNALSLHTIFIISPYNQNDFRLTTLSGGEKIKYLHRLIYNKPFVSGLKKDLVYFNYCAMLAERVEIIMVNRPMFGFQLNKLVECIENTWDVQYATE